jgi:VWFA-related protein
MPRLHIPVALVTAVLALSVHGPAVSARQQPPQRTPVFRGESVLVTVDAYPQRNGKIVEGLTPADFVVLEDGKPQTVENLEFVRVEPLLSEAERRDPNTVGEMFALAADPHNRVFVVFLDTAHVSISGSHNIRRPLVDSLNRIIGEKDLFGVVTANTDPRALTLGRKMTGIEDELTKYWDWGQRNRIQPDAADPIETALQSCFTVHPTTGQPWMVSDNGQTKELYRLLWERRREDRALGALEGLVDRLAAMREARSVAIIVSEGWRLFVRDRGLAEQAAEFGPSMPPVGSRGGAGNAADAGRRAGVSGQTTGCISELLRLADLEDEQRLRDLTLRANRANVSFYPINPAGLGTFDTPISEANQPSMTEDSNRLRKRIDTLLTLADNTDGIAVVNTNDLAAGMRRMVDDVSAYYLLGYYSTNTAHDGRYRRIEVKMKPPNLTVRARRGYFAPADKATRQPAAAAAPAGPEPPKGLVSALGELSRVRANADLYVRGTMAGETMQVVVELTSSRSIVSPWINGADVRVTATGADGATVPPVTARIDANTRGVLVTVPVSAASSALRVVAKVSAGGETLDEAAEIRRTVDGMAGDAILYRGRPAASSPLRPVADLQYRRTERVHVEWPIVGDLDQRLARLLNPSGQPLAVPLTVTERETEGRRVIAADLSLAPLAGGDYVIELTVGRGDRTEVHLVAFRVLQ